MTYTQMEVDDMTDCATRAERERCATITRELRDRYRQGTPEYRAAVDAILEIVLAPAVPANTSTTG